MRLLGLPWLFFYLVSGILFILGCVIEARWSPNMGEGMLWFYFYLISGTLFILGCCIYDEWQKHKRKVLVKQQHPTESDHHIALMIQYCPEDHPALSLAFNQLERFDALAKRFFWSLSLLEIHRLFSHVRPEKLHLIQTSDDARYALKQIQRVDDMTWRHEMLDLNLIIVQ